MTETGKEVNYIVDAWLIIALGLLYGGALAGVQLVLHDRIAMNKRNLSYKAIPLIVPGAVAETVAEFKVEGKNKREYKVFKAGDAQGVPKGWVLHASGPGFVDRIELLVSLDPRFEKILGIYILDQKETPGLGDKIWGEPFRNQYVNLDATDPVKVTKNAPTAGNNEIKALPGATVSSQSVSDIVNQAIANLSAAVLALKEPAAPAPEAAAAAAEAAAEAAAAEELEEEK